MHSINVSTLVGYLHVDKVISCGWQSSLAACYHKQEMCLWAVSQRGWTLLLHPPSPVCHRWHGKWSHYYLQKACFMPCCEVGPLILFTHVLATLSSHFLLPPLCHTMYPRCLLKLWLCYQVTTLHWPGYLRISTHINYTCIYVLLASSWTQIFDLTLLSVLYTFFLYPNVVSTMQRM